MHSIIPVKYRCLPGDPMLCLSLHRPTGRVRCVWCRGHLYVDVDVLCCLGLVVVSTGLMTATPTTIRNVAILLGAHLIRDSRLSALSVYRTMTDRWPCSVQIDARQTAAVVLPSKRGEARRRRPESDLDRRRHHRGMPRVDVMIALLINRVCICSCMQWWSSCVDLPLNSNSNKLQVSIHTSVP